MKAGNFKDRTAKPIPNTPHCVWCGGLGSGLALPPTAWALPGRTCEPASQLEEAGWNFALTPTGGRGVVQAMVHSHWSLTYEKSVKNKGRKQENSDLQTWAQWFWSENWIQCQVPRLSPWTWASHCRLPGFSFLVNKNGNLPRGCWGE